MAAAVPPLIPPVIALASWTFVMELWLYSYRIPDISKYKIPTPPTANKEELNSKIPRHRQWPADNFNHLHEQPTVFYAVALALTFLEVDDGLTKLLAWSYVGARVVHSLIQATSNVIMVRFQAFAVSSLILLGLTSRGWWKCFF